MGMLMAGMLSNWAKAGVLMPRTKSRTMTDVTRAIFAFQFGVGNRFRGIFESGSEIFCRQRWSLETCESLTGEG